MRVPITFRTGPATITPRLTENRTPPISRDYCGALQEFIRFNPDSEIGTSRVESNGRLLPAPLLPLVEPDVRISRIRLSCKHFVIGVEVQVLVDIGSGSFL